MSSRAVGRDRTRRPRGHSRILEAYGNVFEMGLSSALEGNRDAERIVTGRNRALQDITRDVESIKRKSTEEYSDLEKDETKIESERRQISDHTRTELESLNRRSNSLDEQINSQARSIHLLAQRGGKIIADNATLPPHERRGTEVIENEVETGTRRLLELKERKADLDEQKHKLERDLALESKRKEAQLAEVKERKRRLIADKEQRLAEKSIEEKRVIEDAQRNLKSR